MEEEITPLPETKEMPTQPIWLVTVVSGAACVALGSIYGYTVPTFAGMYGDLGQPLPGLSQAIIAMPWIAWVAGGVAMCVALLLKNLYFSMQICRALDVVVTIAAICSVFVMVPALFLPLIGISKSVGK